MLEVEVTPRAAAQIEAAAVWWARNRPAGPDAIHLDFQDARMLLTRRPSIGARSSTVRYPDLRRLHLSRVRYHIYYDVRPGKVVTRGPLKGKRVTFASTERIGEFAQLADEFMERVFDLEPGEYLITDESELCDFTEMGSSDTSEIWKRIDEACGIVIGDVRSRRLVDVLHEVAVRRSRQ